MKLYRVTNKKYADDFTGKGASFTDGARWNSAGNPAIYYGLTIASAVLESTHYIPSPLLMPPTHCKAHYDLPDDVPTRILTEAELPRDWKHMPYPTTTQAIGDAFLKSKKHLLLLLPSTTTGELEPTIALLNPLHPDAKHIKLIKTEKPVYNPRMFQGLQP